jgi:AmiR/NasT family two-component response regulator
MSRARVLLVEPNFVLRRTIVVAARELGVAEIEEASSYAAAERVLAGGTWDAVIVTLDDDDRGLSLLEAARGRATPERQSVALGAVVERADPGRVAALQALRVRRVILKPFRVKQILEMIAAFARTPDPATGTVLAA